MNKLTNNTEDSAFFVILIYITIGKSLCIRILVLVLLFGKRQEYLEKNIFFIYMIFFLTNNRKLIHNCSNQFLHLEKIKNFLLFTVWITQS